MIDLGTLLNYWPDPSDPPNAGRVSHQGLLDMGLPTRAEIVARYAERTGIDTSAARWYEAFAQWKTGVVIQQLHRRWEKRREHGPADGDDRRPPAAARDDGLAAARRARRGAGLSGRRHRPVSRNRPDRAGSHGQDGTARD